MDNKLYKILMPMITKLFRFIYRIEIINKDKIPDGPIIFVGNHKHKYDFISLGCSTNRTIHFLAKKELLDKHSLIFKHTGIIPIDRKNKNKEAIDKAVEYLNNNEVIGIFPEGTFNKTEYVVMPFKYGAVKIASLTDTPIVPFAIVGEYKRFKKGLKIIFGDKYYVKDKRDLTKENIKLMNKVIKLMKGETSEGNKK